MTSKREQYQRGYSACSANAATALPQEIRALWRAIGESYLLLLEYEDQYPTKIDGSSVPVLAAGRLAASSVA
jgi:hypothetical protein